MSSLYLGSSLLSHMSMVGKENAAGGRGKGRGREKGKGKGRIPTIRIRAFFQSITKQSFHFKKRELACTAAWKRCKN